MIDLAITAEDLVPPAIVQQTQRAWRWRPIPSGRPDADWLGLVMQHDLSWPETAALPGLVATVDAVEHERQRRALIELVDRFAVEGFSWSEDRASRPTVATAEAARTFFTALPAGAALPKLAPDSEGALAAVWENNDASVIVIVDGWRLHMVTAPGTPGARYYHDLPFVSGVLPNDVKNAIPSLA